MDGFAAETGIFGLNLLRSGLGRIETIFWIFCTALFAACTIRDLMKVTLSLIGQDMLSLTSQVTNSLGLTERVPQANSIRNELQLKILTFVFLLSKREVVDERRRLHLAIWRNFGTLHWRLAPRFR